MNKRKVLKITIFAAIFILVGIGVFFVAKNMIKNKRLQSQARKQKPLNGKCILV